MFINVRPIEKEPLKWPWKNVIRNGYPFVSESPGEVVVPDIIKSFDWKDFEYNGTSKNTELGTKDMKSIFTTYCRFMGTEKALISLQENTVGEGLKKITRAFLHWNHRLLLAHKGIKYFMVGDDVGYKDGLLLSPELIRKYIIPRWKALYDLYDLYPVVTGVKIFHSDGDIMSLLPDLYNLGVDIILYEPVGKMKTIPPYESLGGILFIPTEHQDNEPFSGYMPQGDHE